MRPGMARTARNSCRAGSQLPGIVLRGLPAYLERMSEDESEVEVESDDDETEVEVEHDALSREEIADHFEAFAGELRSGEAFEIEVSGETVTIDPPESPEFEVEIEDERDDDSVERSIEFELEWDRSDDEDPLPEE